MIPATDLPSEGALEAELLRMMLDTAAHDLGGLSSALALRADVMERVEPSAAGTACGAIASELRLLGLQLRELSGVRGGDALSPTRAGSLKGWFVLLSRFGLPLLGRGVALRGEVDDVRIGTVAAHDLTYIGLALLHAIRDRGAGGHTEIHVTTEQSEQAIAIWIGMRGGDAPPQFAEVTESLWWRWAQLRAAGAQIGMRVDGARVELRIRVENRPSA